MTQKNEKVGVQPPTNEFGQVSQRVYFTTMTQVYEIQAYYLAKHQTRFNVSEIIRDAVDNYHGNLIAAKLKEMIPDDIEEPEQ